MNLNIQTEISRIVSIHLKNITFGEIKSVVLGNILIILFFIIKAAFFLLCEYTEFFQKLMISYNYFLWEKMELKSSPRMNCKEILCTSISIDPYCMTFSWGFIIDDGSMYIQGFCKKVSLLIEFLVRFLLIIRLKAILFFSRNLV